MTTAITMRYAQNWAGERFLGFYRGTRLMGEVDPREGRYHAFWGRNLIGIHSDEGRAIKQLQLQIKAATAGAVKFYMA